jgi:hypothetical protein
VSDGKLEIGRKANRSGSGEDSIAMQLIPVPTYRLGSSKIAIFHSSIEANAGGWVSKRVVPGTISLHLHTQKRQENRLVYM